MQDVHRVEAKPSLVARARTADLLVANGAELEVGWLPVLLQESGNPRIQRGAPASSRRLRPCTLAEVPAKLDRAMGDIHPLGNPHIQLDPRNVAAVAKALTAKLSAVDPAGAETNAARGADFAKRWTEAMARWEARAASAARRAGRDHAPGPGLSAALARPQGARRHRAEARRAAFGRLPRRARHAALGDAAEDDPAERYNDPKAAKWLSERLHAPTVVLPYSVGGSPGAKDLFGLFDDTIESLLGAAK